MKKKLFRFFASAVAAALLSAVLVGCDSTFWFGDTPTEIESGFSERLTDLLKEKYELIIPDCAVFVGGYFTNAFRDPAVVVAFDIALDKLEGYERGMSTEEIVSLILADVEAYNGGGSIDGSYKHKMSEKFGRQYTNGLTYVGEPFTDLIYSEIKDGVISFCFQGHHPGNSFS